MIAFSGALHGRTLLGMALTGKVAPYKIGFGPFPSDIYHAPFRQRAARRRHGRRTGCRRWRRLFKTDIDPKRASAAIIVEPVQGEGGFQPAPADFMRGAARRCATAHGMVMIADEVQTGFGRTGKLFAMEHYDVRPDLVTMATEPGRRHAAVRRCAAARPSWTPPLPGGLGGTYAGNPLAVAAAHAVIDTIAEEKPGANAPRRWAGS